MKTIRFAATLLFALSLAAGGQTVAPQPFQTPALLIREDGSFQRAWLLAATKSAVRYRETAVSTETVDAKLSEFKSVFLFEPREYAAALDLYQSRKYAEARDAFAAVAARFGPVYQIENSHAALAAFYEMECLRQLGDLEGLAAALQKFDKSPLTRENQLRQVELYLLWDAVRTKSWDSLEKLAAERAKTRLPGDQRAQVAYCHGLALEGLERPEEALFAYQTAMTADSGASEVVARQAGLRVLAILIADPGVRKAMKDWGTPAQNKNSVGYARLTEAAAVATLFEKTLGAGAPLPAEFKELLNYRPKEEQAEKKEEAEKK